MKKIFPFCLIAILLSCGRGKAPQKSSKIYFDLTSYFSLEADRLKQRYDTIDKTVAVKGTRESKKVHINNWEKELKAFSDADINKASWRGMFRVEQTADHQLFVSDNKKVQVKKLLVEKRNNSIFHIGIVVKRVNILYTSTDTLDYFPDSLYSIRKTQHIRLLPEKEYTILGRFK